MRRVDNLAMDRGLFAEHEPEDPLDHEHDRASGSGESPLLAGHTAEDPRHDREHDQVLGFLRQVWGEGFHSLCSDVGRFHTVGHYDRPEELYEAARAENGRGGNIWFGAHPMPEKPSEGRGDADDVDKVYALVADLDWHDEHAHKAAPGDLPTEAELRARLARFQFQPTATVNSAHGLQCWWLLQAPVDADKGYELTLRLHAALEAAGLPADRADLASILRIPGTISRKPDCDPVEVVVEQINELVWTPEYLDKYLPKKSKKIATKPGSSNGDIGTPAPAGHWWVDGAIGAGDRHKAIVAAAGWCRRLGMSRDDAIPTIRDVWQRHTPTAYSWEEVLERLDDVYGRYEDGSEARTVDVNVVTGEKVPVPKFFSDAEVGEAFGVLLRGRYLYCRGLGGWLRCDGTIWSRDESETVFEEARQYVLDVGQKLFEDGASGDTIKAAARYRDRGKLDAIVTIARRLDGIAATAAEFDRHPDLLACRNGIVDLQTSQLRPHDPQLRLTQITDVDYRPDATHPDVDTVLDVVDPDVRDWLQRLFGYGATGHTSGDVMPVFDGVGANGKTTLLTAARSALGGYGCVADARLLMRGAHDEHPTLFADLRGRRLVTVEETAEGGSLRVETMKFLTGGSPIKARFIRGDYFEFDPTHLLVVATNHRPAVNSTEHATWRRLRLVPFPHRYAPDDRRRPGDRPVDPGLRDRLKRGRAQREAMLAWIVAGAVAWHRDGLGPCPTVDGLTDAWRRAEDVILRFAHDRLDFDPNADVGAQALYDNFRQWCDLEGRPASSMKEFKKRFAEHDVVVEHSVEQRHTRTGSGWFGCRLK